VKERFAASESAGVRIGAISYLNSKPLTLRLPQIARDAKIVFDIPSRLADRLAEGGIDIALVPSIEYFRNRGCTVVSDACVACDGPVQSVKLYSRVPVERIHTLALDEGSRASAALTRILLQERFGIKPRLVPLPIDVSAEDSTANAMLLIGDRGLHRLNGSYEFVWDLGQEWSHWTGLPFVFAMWIARPNVDLQGVDEMLTAARDEGVCRLQEIAQIEAPALEVPETQCLSYLRDNLVFRLGERERRGLGAFCHLAGRHDLVPAGMEFVFYDHSTS